MTLGELLDTLTMFRDEIGVPLDAPVLATMARKHVYTRLLGASISTKGSGEFRPSDYKGKPIAVHLEGDRTSELPEGE